MADFDWAFYVALLLLIVITWFRRALSKRIKFEFEFAEAKLQRTRRRLLVKLLRERANYCNQLAVQHEGWAKGQCDESRRLVRVFVWCRRVADRIEGSK